VLHTAEEISIGQDSSLMLHPAYVGVHYKKKIEERADSSATPPVTLISRSFSMHGHLSLTSSSDDDRTSETMSDFGGLLLSGSSTFTFDLLSSSAPFFVSASGGG
jgi:hypothetical protein